LAAPEKNPLSSGAAVGLKSAPKEAVRVESTVGAGFMSVPAPAGGKPPSHDSASGGIVLSGVSLRRIPASIDPLGSAAQGLATTLHPFRLAAATKVFGGIQQIQHNVGLILQVLQRPKLPSQLIGALHQPDGTAAARVQVQFHPSDVGVSAPAVTVLTADNGGFTLTMPAGAVAPAGGLSLTVHGANGNAIVNVPAAQIAANGMVGVLTLSQTLTPLPVSILAALSALEPKGSVPKAAPEPPPTKKPTVTIGEAGSVCMQSFTAGTKTESFPWGVFFRIVEPRMSIASETQAVPTGNGRFGWLPIYATQFAGAGADPSKTTYVDRVPVDQPLSVDGFRDQIAGIDTSGHFSADEKVPMAASLGLGYVLWMSQQWKFQGLGLGDLVYSLPLAPGEQQQLAVFERKDTSAVQESEFFSQSEAMNQSAMSDTSTNATFNSAFREAAQGGSQFQTDSSSSSWGANAIFVAGGGGSSSSSGNSSSWLQGQRDTTQQAAQTTHSAAENQASARVTANRTGMRLATGSESMGVTTKTITNHNHTHALTMQYWEVLRMYDVSTAIDGLTLVCLVPMQVVRFMPPGQPATLSDPASLNSHSKVLARYGNILRHLDVLQAAVPRRFQPGLNLLAQFASDPMAMVDSSGSVAEDVIGFRVQGNFLACETISIAAVTKRNTRVGPVQLAPSVAGQPETIPPDQFTSREDLIAWLTLKRQSAQTMLQGSLALPASMNRSDIIGFEITRQFKTVSYTMVSPAMQAIKQLQSQFGSNNTWEPSALTALLGPQANARPTVTLTASDLETLIGGPTLGFFYAAIEDFTASGKKTPSANETYANDHLLGTVLPPQPFPLPALQIAPVLRYHDILEIEKSAQHVVRNTTLYSKALWLSMNAEERAILLDGYTIGVPPGGLADPSQMIPLLNCVRNEVLGTFGNSLMMPFIIPQDVAEKMDIDPAQLQQALLSYQQENFEPPHSTIALPTRGVLGEAVLGHCASAEKIDLTRFWNWQDAPADTAPGIGMVQLPTTTPPLTTGVTAPNSLTNLPPLINNLITAPQPNSALLQAMGQQAASQKDFDTGLTGQQQLATLMQNGQTLANSARSDALKTSQTLTSDAMKTIGDLVGKAMSGGGGKDATPSTPGKTSTPTNQSTPTNKTAGTKQGPGTPSDPGAATGTTTPSSAGGDGVTGVMGDFPIGGTAVDSVGGAAGGAAGAAGDAGAADALGGVAGDAALIALA